jgi:hypothetical protein
MSQVENALGFVFGALFVLGLLLAVGVAAAFLVYLYPIFPWGLRLLAVAEALYVGCVLLAAGAWLVSSDFRSSEPWMFVMCAALYIVLWMYNGLMLHLAGAWGVELDGFTAWVLGFEQASIDWSLGIIGVVFSYVAGFFVALIDALGGDDFRFPDLPSLPDMPDVDVSGPSAPPISSGGLDAVMSWAIESVWSLILGVISAGIGFLVFRQR